VFFAPPPRIGTEVFTRSLRRPDANQVWRPPPHGAGASTIDLCPGGADGRELLVIGSETGVILRARLDFRGRQG
jgi:hypothetical protein